MKRWTGILVAFALGGVSGWLVAHIAGAGGVARPSDDGEDGAAAAPKPSALAAPPSSAIVITAVPVRWDRLDVPITAYGAIAIPPAAVSTVSLPAAVRIESIQLPAGAAAGDHTVVMRVALTSDAVQARAQALAELAAAQEQARLTKQRLALQLATASDLSQADAALAVATTRAEQWRGIAGSTQEIAAPQAGTILREGAAIGAVVPADTELLAVAGSAREVRFGVEPDLLRAIPNGARIVVSVPNQPAITPLTAVVSRIAPAIDEASGLQDLVVALRDGWAPTGALVRGDVSASVGPGAIVPAGCVVAGPAGDRVFVLESTASGQVARARTVRTLARVGDAALVVGDLTRADRVIRPGSDALEDGMAVAPGAEP